MRTTVATYMSANLKAAKNAMSGRKSNRSCMRGTGKMGANHSGTGPFLRPVHNQTVAQRIELHPVTPQPRLLRVAADCLQEGGVIAYPTDSCYALGCALGDKEAMERIQVLRQA